MTIPTAKPLPIMYVAFIRLSIMGVGFRNCGFIGLPFLLAFTLKSKTLQKWENKATIFLLGFGINLVAVFVDPAILRTIYAKIHGDA